MTRTKISRLCTGIVVVCFAASVLTSIQGHVVEFAVEPVDTVVQSGNSAVLDCVVRSMNFSLDTINTQWLDQDRQPINFIGDNYRSQLLNNSLYISSVVADQGLTGTYQCKASLPNGAGSIVSRSARLSLASLGDFQQQPEDVLVFPGQKAHFPCRIVGSPQAKVRWLKDERPLQLDELRMSILPSGALEIDEIGDGDQGSYRCNASGLNSHKLSNKANLVINTDLELQPAPSPPSFIVRPQSNVVVTEGQTVTLDCAANGNPRPKVKWLKDGANIDMADLDSRFIKVGTTSSLKISNIKEEDAGTYQCLAENREDSLDAGSTVEVQVPPKFKKRPTDKIEYVSKDVELECVVYGKPEPVVQWLKNGELIHPTGYHQIVNGNNLKIMGLLQTDTGLFQCIATNPAGNVQAAASLKIIQQDYDIPSSKKNRRKKFQHKSTSALDELQSQALFASLKPSNSRLLPPDLTRTGNPPSERPNSFQILTSLSSSTSGSNPDTLGTALNAYSDPTQSLTSRKRQQQQQQSVSSFTGTWLDSSGDVSDEERLRQLGSLPGPPLDVEAIVTKARFIVVTWKPPQLNGEEIVAYSVFYRQDGNPRERVQNTTRSRLEEVHLSNLQPSTIYHVRVVAFNRLGMGQSSDSLAVTTGFEENVPSAPRNLNAHATSSLSVHVRWEEPAEPHGEAGLVRYNVNYMQISGSEQNSIETVNTELDINNLSVFTEYSIWVDARNMNGLGASTQEVNVRTFGAAPSEPPHNVTLEPTSSTSILVRWSPPPLDAQNGVITGYKLRYKQRGLKGDTVTTPANTRLHALLNLDRASAYQVRLWAMNVNGTGPPSDWMDVDTYENDLDESRVPDVPGELRVKATANSIIAFWTPPRNQNIKVRNYILGWGKGIPDMYSQELSERDREYTIEPLESQSDYVVSLRASNEMGAGEPKYANIRTIDGAPPEPQTPLLPPIGLKAQVLGETSVVLYWTDTTISKNQYVSDNRYYVVHYQPEGLKAKEVNVSTNNVLLSDLKPGTMYEFMVRLVKGKRESPWSMVVVNYTSGAPLNAAPREFHIQLLQEDSQMVKLSWLPPKPSGMNINGYVILFTTDQSKRDRDWNATAVKGDRLSCEITNLETSTKYYFKVQARINKGYGPFSPIVPFETGPNIGIPPPVNKAGVFSGSTLLYLIAGALILVLITIILAVFCLCCRPRDVTSSGTSPDRSKKGYHQGNSQTSIKPPDLWIHHDQMELKNLDGKASNDGASSSGALTLPRSTGDDYDRDVNHMNSLDKHGYAPSYMAVATATPINSSAMSHASSDSTPVRPQYPRTQYTISSRAHVTIDQNGLPNSQIATENPYATHTHTPHGSYDPNGSSYSNQMAANAHVPHSNSSGYASGMMGIMPEDKRVPCGVPMGVGAPHPGAHPLKSFTVPAPPPISAPVTMSPPIAHMLPVRPNSSPYKKQQAAAATLGAASPATSTLTCSTPPQSRVHAANAPAHTLEEVQRLRPSHSTEELNQEMEHLKGLMITLNKITANEFEC